MGRRGSGLQVLGPLSFDLLPSTGNVPRVSRSREEVGPRRPGRSAVLPGPWGGARREGQRHPAAEQPGTPGMARCSEGKLHRQYSSVQGDKFIS